MTDDLDTTFKLAATARGDVREAAARAREHRFAGLSIDARLLREAAGSMTGLREVRAILSRSGLAAAALRAALPGRGLDGAADGDRVLDRLRRGVEVARGVGFACVACDLGAIPRGPRPARKPTPVTTPLLGGLILPTADDLARVGGEVEADKPLSPAEREHAAMAAAVLRAAGELADRAGVAIAVSASLASTHDLASLLATVAAPLLLRELDTAASAGELAADAASVVGASPPVLHVAAGDAQVASDGRSRAAALGEGDVPWAELWATLAEADYAGFVTLPPDVRAARLP